MSENDVVDIYTREPPIEVPVKERQEEVVAVLEKALEQARAGVVSGVWIGKQYTDGTTQGEGGGRCHTRSMVGLMEEQKFIWFERAD